MAVSCLTRVGWLTFLSLIPTLKCSFNCLLSQTYFFHDVSDIRFSDWRPALLLFLNLIFLNLYFWHVRNFINIFENKRAHCIFSLRKQGVGALLDRQFYWRNWNRQSLFLFLFNFYFFRNDATCNFWLHLIVTFMWYRYRWSLGQNVAFRGCWSFL